VKKLVATFIVIIFLTGCASIKTSWVAENFTRAECSLPEKLTVTASINNYEIVLSTTNSTGELWYFDINTSEIRLPSIGWQSGLVDNHAGNRNSRKNVALPGTSVLKVYAKSLIEETDDEMKDVVWKPWPINEDQNIEIVIVLKNPEALSKACLLKAEFKSHKKP
jgi:hypothetical protein